MLNRLRSRFDFVRDVVSRTGVERYYRKNLPPISHGAKDIILVEGLWDNPNHWLRLWVFLHAILQDRKADVVAVVRKPENWDNWRKQKSLEALGIRRFLYLNEPKRPDLEHLKRATALIGGATDARQMLELQLPDELPAYTFFDTVLKKELHPQPVVENNPVWAEVLAELLRLGDLYRTFFEQNKVVAVVSSHAWKSEWASLCWTALRRGIHFYYMTAHYDSLRLRKMSSVADYSSPNEHLPFAEFDSLSQASKDRLIGRGRAYLQDRFSGNAEFIVLRYSVNLKQRGVTRGAVVKGLGLDPAKPLVVIYAHSWFDFPHTQAMKNFTEPLDWLNFTLDTIKSVTNVNWAIKPHPCDRWYGVIRVQDIFHGLPTHIVILPEDSDSLAIQNVADALVTIQGSIAIEGAANGKPVLCADRGMYTEWGFTHTAKSREDYAAKLRDIQSLAKPTEELSNRALAFAATALAPPPPDAGSLKLTCDTRFTEGKLYPSVKRLLRDETQSLDREIDKVREWLATPYHSYNAWRAVDYCVDRRSL